jgi:hypothetical protein
MPVRKLIAFRSPCSPRFAAAKTPPKASHQHHVRSKKATIKKRPKANWGS